MVYKFCKQIPKGRVSSYGELAKAMKSRAYRAVGTALKKNPHAPIVPCHRVVNSNGSIGGFAAGIKKKIRLLESEGVRVRNNRIVDFKKKLFRS